MHISSENIQTPVAYVAEWKIIKPDSDSYEEENSFENAGTELFPISASSALHTPSVNTNNSLLRSATAPSITPAQKWRKVVPNTDVDDDTKRKYVLSVFTRLKLTRREIAKQAGIQDFRSMNYWVRGKELNNPNVIECGRLLYEWAVQTDSRVAIPMTEEEERILEATKAARAKPTSSSTKDLSQRTRSKEPTLNLTSNLKTEKKTSEENVKTPLPSKPSSSNLSKSNSALITKTKPPKSAPTSSVKSKPSTGTDSNSTINATTTPSNRSKKLNPSATTSKVPKKKLATQAKQKVPSAATAAVPTAVPSTMRTIVKDEVSVSSPLLTKSLNHMFSLTPNSMAYTSLPSTPLPASNLNSPLPKRANEFTPYRYMPNSPSSYLQQTPSIGGFIHRIEEIPLTPSLISPSSPITSERKFDCLSEALNGEDLPTHTPPHYDRSGIPLSAMKDNGRKITTASRQLFPDSQ